MAAPKYYELFNPLIRALHELGGSGSNQELEESVSRIYGISEDDLSEVHRGNRTKFSYNLAWARTYLKRYGLLENSERGVWALSEKGSETHSVIPEDVIRFVQQQDRSAQDAVAENVDADVSETAFELRWQDQVLETLKTMSPDSFERLCQRLLRESGFIHVEVTGRSGDGGIDGKGVVKIGGILSFHVIFQCKRYKDTVSSSAIRDFRGAMVGRADKGLFITTGSFTRDAKFEAQRDGAPPLDMIDGEQLVTMLKELRLGIEVKQRTIEEISINHDWFCKI